VPLRVAVMGCVVNGPGEAREADLGVASGNGKGQIFVKGEVIKTVPESKIVETLIEEAMRRWVSHWTRSPQARPPSLSPDPSGGMPRGRAPLNARGPWVSSTRHTVWRGTTQLRDQRVRCESSP